MGLATSAISQEMLGIQNGFTTRTAGTGKSDFQSVYRNVVQNKAESMDSIFEEASSRYGGPVSLIKAVAKAESNFDTNAVSKAGAMGVMQLMPATAKSMGVTNPFDARQNIMGGTKCLKEHLDRFGGDVSLALAAYNAGPGSVQKYGGIPPYQETQNYVKKVFSYMNGSPIYTGKTVTTGGSGALSSLYGSSSYGSASNQLLSLYGSSAGSLGSLYGTSSDSSDGLLGGSYSQLAGLYGTSYNQLAGLYGLSGMGGMDMMGLLSSASEGDGDTVTLDKNSYASLIQLLRLQMMMNASREVGTISL